MQSLNSPGNLARESAAIPNRVSIATYVPDYHLGGAFRALSPDDADYFRAALWAAVGTLDVWAGNIASSGVPRDIERAQRMFTAAFLLSLHEGMWCQAVSDPTPYAVTLGGACYPNDTFIPTWSHVLPGSLVIPKPNMPAHRQQTERMIPVLYEVLTTHMGVAPRAAGGGPGTPSIMPGGSQLTPGQQIWSPDGRYRLTFQTDGNLVIYRNDGAPVWWTGTVGISPNVARMQTDGNFVIYDTANDARWHTYTFGNPGAYLSMQNNGAIVIYTASGARLWGSPVARQRSEYAAWRRDSSTPSPDTLAAGARLYPGQAVQSLDRRFALTYQTDGNLVLYGPGGVPRWSTQAFSSPGICGDAGRRQLRRLREQRDTDLGQRHIGRTRRDARRPQRRPGGHQDAAGPGDLADRDGRVVGRALASRGDVSALCVARRDGHRRRQRRHRRERAPSFDGSCPCPVGENRRRTIPPPIS